MPSQTATFGGGCFWCTEAVFEQLRGVSKVVSGYSGGHVLNPTYEQVCGKGTGHAEVIRVTFDPDAISYRQLLDVFFATHDPTTKDRQGNDAGPQYRSVIYHHDAGQKQVAEEAIADWNREGAYPNPIVTEVAEAGEFYPAEAYHQGYFRANPAQPYCAFVVGPKAAKTRKLFASLLKE
jgi:peptide-methionine (S)-S-oxide reductase